MNVGLWSVLALLDACNLRAVGLWRIICSPDTKIVQKKCRKVSFVSI